FPIDEGNVDVNESIQSVGGDEDDLLDDEEQQADQSGDDETQENNDMTTSPFDQIQTTAVTTV
ncbi:unnamed protein product, partial [Rotaria socialis]